MDVDCFVVEICEETPKNDSRVSKRFFGRAKERKELISTRRAELVGGKVELDQGRKERKADLQPNALHQEPE